MINAKAAVLRESARPYTIELWRAGRLPFDDLIEKFPLSDINSAEGSSLSGQTIKPVLLMPS